jgi:hypothetical protein
MGTSLTRCLAISPRHKPLCRVWVIPYLVLMILQTTGCNMTKPPTEIFSRAEMKLRTAAEALADQLAPMELQRAREKLAESKKAMAAGKYEDARRLAEIAHVEAELAEAKADAEIMRWAADGLRQSIDALRQEIERGTIRGSAAVAPKE